MADYNQLPMKIEADNEEYVIQLGDPDGEYGEEDLLSPNESGDFTEYSEYHDAVGKLRLKRRRKCGQCGPCQVKENCDKCHFCLRRDVLKQSCIYRKCLYLRKKMPRVRSDSSNGMMQRQGAMQSVVHPTSPPVVCVSPNQGQIHSPNEINSCRLPSPQFCPGAQSPPVVSPPAQQHMDPLRGFQPDVARHMSPDTMRPFSQEAMRSHSVERPRSHQGDMRPMSAEAALSPTGPSVNQPQPNVLRHLPTDPYQAHMNHLQNLQNGQLPQMPKDQIMPRTLSQLRQLSNDQYGSPYGPPRHMMPSHGIPNPYGFPASNIPPQVSSNQMSIPTACRYTVPTQAPFHPHLAYNSSLRHTSPSGSIMSPPFYPPPPHGVPTSLASLPLGQYPPHPTQGSYPGAGFSSHHPAMYPGGLYRPFRPPNEHFIYHARLPPPSSVFSEQSKNMSQFRDKYLKKTDEDEDQKKFDVFRLTKKTDTELMREKYMEEDDSTVKLCEKELNSRVAMTKPHVDDDLLEQMNNISRDHCNVTISIDDLKMQAFIRSDGTNNLEIEIESPSSSIAWSPESVHSPQKECSNSETLGEKSKESETVKLKEVVAKRKVTVSGTVCLKQDLGDEGIMQLELPGHKVQIEETVLEDSLVKQSDNPSELVKFISDSSASSSPTLSSSSFPETIIIS